MNLGSTPVEQGKNRTRTSQDGMTLDEGMTQNLRKELNEKNLEGLNGIVEKINNERISLLWTYG